MSKKVEITKPIRLIELFAGYGSQAMALKRIGAEFENYKVIENDKFAIKSYNAIHGTNFEVLDIKEIHAEDLNICDTDKYYYMLTYSFPCTDLSVAGRQAGMGRDSATRSGLLWEVERILTEIYDSDKELPQMLFMENVPAVHNKKNIADFEEWKHFLESIGYKNFWQDLNAKNYGVAQSRNRCYMFSFLDDVEYEFPEPVELNKTVVDYLEDEVEEKFYMDGERADNLIQQLIDKGQLIDEKTIAATRTRELVYFFDSDTIDKEVICCVVLRREKGQCSNRAVYALNKKHADKKIDIAQTICARDYKGFGTGTETMNGVITWKSEN